MKWIHLGLVIIILLLLGCKKNKEISSYVNYEKMHENPILNCPEQYEIGMGELSQRPQTIQPFGYTKSHVFDMTRFIVTDIPIPVDPDFFM